MAKCNLGEVKLETMLAAVSCVNSGCSKTLQGLSSFTGLLLRSSHLLALSFASWDIDRFCCSSFQYSSLCVLTELICLCKHASWPPVRLLCFRCLLRISLPLGCGPVPSSVSCTLTRGNVRGQYLSSPFQMGSRAF